jgi:SAM-dependent methyltransferase
VKEATALALNALNQLFYTDSAALFDETRRAPWPGWREILPLFRERPVATILDVGCGNGRLARFLTTELGAPFLYFGIDASAPLLSAAANAVEGLTGARLLRGDLVLEPPERVLPDGPFDCVVAFGLLHHIPGEARRRALIRALARRVAPGGILALAFWDFAGEPRFAAKALSGALLAEVADDLEPGDHLLRWGAEGSVRLRYCHHADEAEQTRLLAGLPLQPRLSFASDGRSGRLNRYRVLERR